MTEGRFHAAFLNMTNSVRVAAMRLDVEQLGNADLNYADKCYRFWPLFNEREKLIDERTPVFLRREPRHTSPHTTALKYDNIHIR